MKKTGGELLIDALLNEDVKSIFSVSGTAIMHAYDACLGAGLKIYHTRSEAAAVAMADGWARTTGQPGICMVTLGAGGVGCVSGMFNAFSDGSPVILIAGRGTTANWGRGDFAEIDAVSYMKPLTKWADTVLDTERIPECLLTALRHAKSGRPGPVLLQIPSNVMSGTIEYEDVLTPKGKQPVWRSQADPAAIAEAAKLMQNAERPILIVGSGVFWSQVGNNLVEFIRRMQIPVFACHLSRESLTNVGPHYFGAATTTFLNPIVRYAAANCDLLVAMGVRFDFELEFGSSKIFNPDAKVIQIDLEPTYVGQNRSVDVGLVGDIGLILEQLMTCITGKLIPPRTGWYDSLRKVSRQAWDDRKHLSDSNKKPIHPAKLCSEIANFLDENAIITLGGGNIYCWGRVQLDSYLQPPRHRFGPYHSGALGFAIPFATAAKLAKPDRQVLALSGDGSIGYDIMEMDTASRYGIPIVCVVANDSNWSMITWAQRKMFGPDRVYATDLMTRSYDEITKVLGGYGETVTEPEQIRPALERAFASGLPACLNVLTEPAYSPDLQLLYGDE